MSIGTVTVVISSGFSGAYEQLLPEFERTSGIKVKTRSGASQGVGPQTIAAQLDRGVSADVVILSREGLGELMAANRIVAGTDVDLAQVPPWSGRAAGDSEARREHRWGYQTAPAQGESRRGPWKHQRDLA
jgi:molybdate transport system substrate-binding protein